MSSNLRERLLGLDALIAGGSEDPAKALAKLDGLMDPVSIRRRVGLLLNLDRVKEAHSTVSALSPNAEWLEIGIRAALRAEDIDLARSLLQVAPTLDDPSGTLPLRAAASFADAVLLNHVRSTSAATPHRSTQAVEPTHRELMSFAARTLLPFGSAMVTAAAPHTPLKEEALTLLCLLLGLTGKGEEAVPFLRLLSEYGQINLQIGQLAVEGYLPTVDGLQSALRKAQDFERRLCGILLEQNMSPDAQRTFTNLSALIVETTTLSDKEVLFSALAQTAIFGAEAHRTEVKALSHRLIDISQPTNAARLGAFHLGIGEPDKALELLMPHRDSPVPLVQWVYGKACYAKGNFAEALERAIPAATTWADQHWLLEAADLAYRQEDVPRAITCLMQVKHFYPWDIISQRNLVAMLVRSRRYDEALSTMQGIVAAQPDDAELQLQLAQLYFQTSKVSLALPILEHLIGLPEKKLQTVLLLSAGLRQIGNPGRAFEVLNSVRSRYWDDKDFLFAFLEAGYASGHERDANEALGALQELRKKGALDPELLREASLDDLLALGKAHQERNKLIAHNIVQGKAPWTIWAEIGNRPFILDWMSRTQPLRWLAEDIESRASFSIYATNGFTVGREDEATQLVPFEVPNVPASVCLDYSSMITLHQLGKLDVLFTLFPKIIVPEEFRSALADDIRRLHPHQISRREGFRALKNMVEEGRIQVVDELERLALPLIDEYADPLPANGRRLVAITNILRTSARIDDTLGAALLAVSRQPDVQGAPSLAPNDRLVIDLTTLMTIYGERALDAVVSAFHVCISQADNQELVSDLRGFTFQADALKNLKDMWSAVDGQPSVSYQPAFAPSADRAKEDDVLKRISLASARLAERMGAPLLVDDRALQTLLANKLRSPSAAFGTDALLRHAWRHGTLPLADYFTAFMRLIRWRYRFLVPDPELLHHAARQFSGTSPGALLTDIARYGHDCMRDLGLFGGLEPTDPPTSMALKLYMKWLNVAGEFLALVWEDQAFSDDRARALTAWTARAMLPSVPIAVAEGQHGRIAALTRESPIISALLRSGAYDVTPRVSENLRKMAAILGLTDRRYEDLVIKVIGYAAR